MKKAITLIFICLSICIYRSAAQNETNTASTKMDLAIKMMQQGFNDEAIVLLDEADAMDPTPTYKYLYEKAFAYYQKEEYRTAIKLLRKSLKFDDATDLAYQMLGNAYDMSGNPKKALKTYAEGLKKFPGSGRLYRESGVIHYLKGEYDRALQYFMDGAEVEPHYPSNWFGAATLFLTSDNKAMTMIYGETAICLEPESERSHNMGKILLDTYRDNITFSNDTTAVLSFANKTITLSVDDIFNFKIPLPIVYELIMAGAVGTEKNLDVPSLIEIRRRFVEVWFAEETKYYKDYPVHLFDFHRALIDAGHFEAYNYWLFSFGDSKAMDEWYLYNEKAFEAFVEWFNKTDIIQP